jgi:autotransporter translocation and assembly factor TamB
MKRALRWAKRIALGVLAFAVLAVAITIGALHTQWGRDRVRRLVEDQLQAAFPGSTIGRIDGSVLGELIVRDVTLVGRDHRPLVTIETFRLRAAILPLFGKTARVEQVTADGVVVYAHDQGPAPARPAAPPAASEPATWSIELPSITVERARVEIETASGTEQIEELAAGVSLSLRAGEPLIASVRASARWRAQPIALDAVLASGDRLAVPYAVALLGGARALAIGVEVDGARGAGHVAAFAPAALVSQLGGPDLPGDAALLAHLAPSGQLELAGTVGSANLYALAKADLDRPRAHAIVTADVPDVAAFVPRAEAGAPLAGRGTLCATVVATPAELSGMVAIAGAARGVAGTALLGVSATGERATLVAAGSGAGWLAAGAGDATRTDDGWSLTRSQLVARAHDLAPMRGELSASLSARGPLAPAPSLSVTGTVDARDVRYDDLAIALGHAQVAATAIPARPAGTLDLELTGLQRGALAIPLASASARGALHEDGTIDIDLGDHRVRTAGGQLWSGSGGHVRVTEQSIVATQLATASGPSRITAQAAIGRTSDLLAAKATVRDVMLAMLDPALGGSLAADVDVRRRDGVWRGTIGARAHQVVLPGRPVLDGDLAIAIAKRRVTARATAANPAIGSATLDLDVIGPRDITDAAAWRRLERSAIQSVRIALAKIDASKLGASGNLDGELAISASGAGGKVDVRGVVTGVGTLDSQLALGSAARGEIAAHGTLQLGGVDPVDVDATLALPPHPFDPAGWRALGRATLRDATIEAKRLAFDPALMKRFGVDSPWRGWAAVKIHVGPGARSSELALDIHELRDGPLAKPVDVQVTGTTDAAGVRADATVRADKVSLVVAAKSPLSLEAILAGDARKAPLEATVTVPAVAAREVALVLGRDDVLAGTLAGDLAIGGTLETPTARARLAVDNLSVAAGIASKPPTLEKLELDARWLGVARGFELELTGHETGGRLLKISARGKPDSLDSVVASIEAASFDISPFVAFAPPGSIAAGMRGLVGGVLKLRGLDPQTGDVRGRLVVTDARIPLAAELGTLRSGRFELDIVKKNLVATIDGKLGRGTVKGKATVRLTGSMPTAAEVTLAVRQVSPIGDIQPIIDADVAGWFARTKTKWTGKLAVTGGNVYVPPEGGSELLVAGTPSDIVFIDDQHLVVKPKRKPPSAPWLVADVDIAPTKIVVDDTDFNFDGVASGQVKLLVGDAGVGLDGSISTERGRVDVLGRSYRLDHGVVDFDGSLDPRLDIQMSHDFRTLTLTVDIAGRSSAPDLRLSADTGSYSQGQLLAFLAGATPSDDPTTQSGDAVAGGSLSVLSSRLGKRLNKRLPLIKFDTINYEAQTASSSRAIRVGKQIGEHTYLSFRNRFEPRPNENPQEATIEHELRRNIIIEASGGQRAAGADLLWRKRW